MTDEIEIPEGFVKVTVKITGIYPAEDIDMVAAGLGCPAGDNKLDFIIGLASEEAKVAIGRLLAKPADNYLVTQTTENLILERAALETRVTSQLQAELVDKQLGDE